eukprot:TRINITY_DN9389_c0_g1_i6.p1 TRINITY_DN9389_c0_g1~~TRINITY_DN9389_c0_g1_i6.p1  ORF type:complete len:1279 (-),score=272.44 TRINITY_DN9389_c0_g1_i6:184-4020(-)
MSAMVRCFEDSNVRVCLGALECTRRTIDLMRGGAQRHTDTIAPELIARMAHAKAAVQDASLKTVQTLMRNTSPEAVFAYFVRDGFSHNSWRVKQMTLVCFLQTIATFGPQSLPIESLVEPISSCLTDANNKVREAAFESMREAYRYLGEQVEDILTKAGTISAEDFDGVMDRIKLVDFDQAPSYIHNTNSAAHFQSTPQSKQGFPHHKNPNKTANESELMISASVLSDAGGNAHMHARAHKIPQALVEDDMAQYTNGLSLPSSGDVPISISSEREFVREVDSLHETLKDTSYDWEERVNALHRFWRIVEGGATQFPCFIAQLHRLKIGLTQQVKDLRSKVPKEACQVIAALSFLISDKFEPFADHFFPHLFKSLSSSVSIVKEAINTCLRSVIYNTRSSGLLRNVLESLSPKLVKDASLRVRAQEYLHMILREWPPVILSKSIQAIDASLRASLSDPDDKVRQLSRKSFCVFSRIWPEHSQRVLVTLDPQIQRLLNQDLHRERLAGIENQSQLYDARPEVNRSRSSGAARPRDAWISEHLESTSHQHSANRSTTSHRLSQSTSKATASSRVTANRSSSTILERPRPTPSARATTPQRSLSPARKQAQTLSDSIRPARSAIPSESSKVLSHPDFMPSGIASNHAETSLEISDIILMSSQSLWTMRLNAFQELDKLLLSERLPELRHHSDRLISIFLERFADTHPKVLLQVLESFRNFVTAFSDRVESYLERIIPRIAERATDARDPIRNASTALLDSFRHFFDPERVYPMCLRVLDVCNPRAKAALLDYMTSLVPDCGSYFSSALHVRQSLAKITSFILEKGSDLKEVTTGLYLKIYAASPDRVLEHLETIAPPAQGSLRRILISNIQMASQGLQSMQRSVQPEASLYSSNLRSTVPASSHEQHLRQFTRLEKTLQSDDLSDKAAHSSKVSVSAQSQSLSRVGLKSEAAPTQYFMPPNPKALSSLQNSNPQYASWQGPNTDNTINFSHDIASKDTASDVNSRLLDLAAMEHKEKANSRIFSDLTEPVINSSHLLLNASLMASKSASKAPAKKSVAESNAVVQILRHLTAELYRVEALHRLIRLSRENLASVWSPYFGPILTAVLNSIADPEPQTRELVHLVLQEMATHQSSHFRDYVELVLPRLLDGLRDPIREVVIAAESSSEVFVRRVAPEKCLENLALMLPSEEPPVLTGVVHSLSIVVERLTGDYVVTKLPNIVPGLFRAFSHASPVVRKAVVFCLVAVHHSVGSHLEPYLESLTPPQRKLVSVYLENNDSATRL